MSKLFLYTFLGMSLCLFSCKSTTQLTDNQTTSYEAYVKERATLLKKDSLLYFDATEKLNSQEQLLNQKLVALQKGMIADYKANHFFPPARNFYQSKTHIEQTPFFQVLRKMPKGGILHLHSGAMGDARWMANKAIEVPEMHVFWESTNDQYTKGQLQAYAKDKAPKGFNLLM